MFIFSVSMFASYCMPPHLNSCNRICKYTDKHHNVPIEVLDHSIDSRIDIVMLVDPCIYDLRDSILKWVVRIRLVVFSSLSPNWHTLLS